MIGSNDNPVLAANYQLLRPPKPAAGHLLFLCIESFLLVHLLQLLPPLVLHLHLVVPEVLTTTLVQFLQHTPLLGEEGGRGEEGRERREGGREGGEEGLVKEEAE